MQENSRKQALEDSQKRNTRTHEQQKQLSQWRQEKRKAEEMLLMQPLSQNVLMEQPEYDEISNQNGAKRKQS